MRILFWTQAYWPHIGGLEVLVDHLAAALTASGHEVMVITSRLADTLSTEVYKGVAIHRFPFTTALHRRNLAEITAIRRAILDLIAQFSPDVLHVHFSGPAEFFHRLTASGHRVPTLVTMHTVLHLTAQGNGLHETIFPSAAWVTTVSASLLDELRALVPAITPRSSVIRNGLPLPDLSPSQPHFDPPRLVFVGRVVPEKGVDIAIAALAQLQAHFPTATLVIAGDGPERASLTELAQGLGLADRVQFLGWVAPDKIPALIDTASLVVMPSRWREPFGLVAVQAGQMARPLVATHVGGLPEIVIDGETGWLVPPEDPTALAEAVTRVLADPVQATQMGQVARRHAIAHFGPDCMVNDYVALYRQLA